MKKQLDIGWACFFSVLSVGLIFAAFTSEAFFEWAFKRHQNQLSWYIRPLFLIPFCYFAYRRSLAGVAATLFLLLSSMFWFSQPESVSEEVRSFLQMEQEWLRGEWTFLKILMALLIPVSLTALGAAFWRRSPWLGIAVMLGIAVGKMLWSLNYGGESGKSILLPAIAGLILCVGLISWGFRKAE